MKKKKKIVIVLLSVFFLLTKINAVFSQTKERNCDYKTASLYFNNPTPILEKYSKEYFCSDISYLEKNKIGNITLKEYQDLYGEASNNFNYLRSIGITPEIIEKYFKEDGEGNNPFNILKTKEEINNYIKAMIPISQIGSDFKIIPASSFNIEDSIFKNSNYQAGNIVNNKGKNCIKDKRLPISSSTIYESTNPNYFEILSSLPVIDRPIGIKGNNLINIFGEVVGKIEYNTSIGGSIIGNGLDKSSIKKITFKGGYLNETQSVNVNWDEKNCKTESLSAEVSKSSVCFMCPYIVMIFNEISYLLNYMYENFRIIIISFVVLFGSFFFATRFFTSFKGLLFDVDIGGYFKDIGEKLRLIFIVSAVLLMPPKILFSFTFEPIMDLTTGLSSRILSTGNNPSSCNLNSVVDEINAEKRKRQDENILPPIVKIEHDNRIEKIEEGYLLSKDTMGSIICFLTNTINTNGKYMMMGKVLMRNIFNFNSDNKILGFFIGLFIWGIFFIINFMISFYILDALLDILKIAILWPFMVFGYAFNWIGFNITSIISTAKNFGLTMISLSIFSLFNRTLIYSFYFTNEKSNVLSILDKAIANNDADIIIQAIPTDIISVSQFLFILYAMAYIYANLSSFASSYGGSIGSISLGNNIKKTFLSILKLKVVREEKDRAKNNENTKEKSSTSNEEKEDEIRKEETEVEVEG